MLVKQLWRILQAPNSLVVEILQNKYFKYKPLMKAKLGQRPSYLWRSFIAAMDLIKDGFFWKMGTESSTRIWGG